MNRWDGMSEKKYDISLDFKVWNFFSDLLFVIIVTIRLLNSSQNAY